MRLSAHVFKTLAAGDVNRIQLVQEENLANKLHISPGFCKASEVDARELIVTNYCQGLESDYSTSTIPPEQKDSCQWAEVTRFGR